MLTNRFERKERLGFGAIRETAKKVGCSEALVSSVVNDKAPNTALVRRVKVVLARRMRMRVDDAFPPAPSLTRPVAMQEVA